MEDLIKEFNLPQNNKAECQTCGLEDYDYNLIEVVNHLEGMTLFQCHNCHDENGEVTK